MRDLKRRSLKYSAALSASLTAIFVLLNISLSNVPINFGQFIGLSAFANKVDNTLASSSA